MTLATPDKQRPLVKFSQIGSVKSAVDRGNQSGWKKSVDAQGFVGSSPWQGCYRSIHEDVKSIGNVDRVGVGYEKQTLRPSRAISSVPPDEVGSQSLCGSGDQCGHSKFPSISSNVSVACPCLFTSV